MESVLRFKLIAYPLILFEFILGLALSLPIPVYSTIIHMMVTNMPGLPGFTGMYIRAIYYRWKLRKMESNVLIDQYVFFAYPKTVELKEFSYIDKSVIVMSKSCKVGRRVHIAPRVFISGGGHFEIEDYACIATGANVITSTEALRDGARGSGPMVTPTQRKVLRGHVIIKKDAFIGASATILPNVIVAQGSVIGAGTVVTKDTEPWQIYVGARATRIATREAVKWQDD